MSHRLLRLWPRLLALFVFANLALLMGCGGSAGVDNGSIVGKVFSNLRDRSAVRLPEPGVTVVAQREGGTPPLIRTTVTDANGNFTFGDLPTGSYVVGYAKEGFQTIDTQAGSTATRTAVGSQVRLFIDSGRTSVAPDVTMRALVPSGDVTIIVSVFDLVTSQPITDAVVTVGTVSQSQNVNGVYTVNVPILRGADVVFGSIQQVDITIRAEGFRGFGGGAENTLRVLPGETQRFVARMTPLSGATDAAAITLQGTYRFSSFQNLLALTPGIVLRVIDLADAFIPPTTHLIPASGTWNIVGLPPSTATITRQFTLVFEHPNIKTFTLARVVMPRSGTKTITQVVVLDPITVDVIGTINASADNGNTVCIPDGGADYAQIIETGQTTSVINGQFLMPNVPVRNSPDDAPWTIRVVVSCSGIVCSIRRCEDLTFRPVSTGPSTSLNCPTCFTQTFDLGLRTCKICDP